LWLRRSIHQFGKSDGRRKDQNYANTKSLQGKVVRKTYDQIITGFREERKTRRYDRGSWDIYNCEIGAKSAK